MEKFKEMIAKLTIMIARNGLKNDLESTGSAWNFQPKIPERKKAKNETKK